MNRHRRAEQSDRQRRYFESVDTRYLAPTASNYVNRQVDTLIDFAGLRRNMRILDVGCGLGRYTVPLAQRGFAVEALDISPVLLEQLRAHDPTSSIRTHCASLVGHPSELDGGFDAVVGFFVLHHLEDISSQFHAASQLLRAGGRVAFLEPNPFNPLYYFQITFSPNMRWWAEKGMFSMRERVVFPALRSAKFVGLERRTFGFLPPFAINRSYGPRLEARFESVPLWRRMLPFQLFRATLGPPLKSTSSNRENDS